MVSRQKQEVPDATVVGAMFNGYDCYVVKAKVKMRGGKLKGMERRKMRERN